MSSSKTSAPKRRPGRPKKEKPEFNIPHRGIINKPDKEDSHMEIIYHNPYMWNRIFYVINKMKFTTVNMHFTKENIIITSQLSDKNNKCVNQIYVCVKGEKQNSYYCESPFSIQLECGDIQKYLQELCTNHVLIGFVSRKLDMKSKLRMFFKYKGEINSTDQHDIDVRSGETPSMDSDEFKKFMEMLEKEENYPVSMVLPFAFFKKKISQATQMTNEIKIMYENGRPLEMQYHAESNKSFKRITFNDPAEIDLKTNVEEGDIFSASVYISNIKHFSNANIMPTFKLSVDRKNPMIFTVLLDNDIGPDKKTPIPNTEACVIKVTASIINYG